MVVFSLVGFATLLLVAMLVLTITTAYLWHSMRSKKTSEDTIYKLAYYDTLTELPNRYHFNEKAVQLVKRASEHQKTLALFLVDLDDFKKVNDTLGHHTGDEVLKEIARRLDKSLHDASCYTKCGLIHDPNNFTARLGGDEFVLIINDIVDEFQCGKIAENIIAEFTKPITVDGYDLDATISVGVSILPVDGRDLSSLLKAADLALYHAKDHGKNQYSFHKQSMVTQLKEAMLYEKVIRDIIDTGDFDIHYQPIYNVQQYKICGVESLLRVKHDLLPDLELEKLIKVAEDTGLIVPLGEEILRRACWQCRGCLDDGHDLVAAVNLSIRQLEHHDIIQTIFNILKETNLPPENLALEVTETSLMNKFKPINEKLSILRGAGIHISLDDFGTGYSSMEYVKRLSVDKLKIDISFIRDINENEKSVEIVRAMTLLGKTLGMKVCAEGIETEKQFLTVRNIGVDQAQGYLLGKPMSVDDLKIHIESRTR